MPSNGLGQLVCSNAVGRIQTHRQKHTYKCMNTNTSTKTYTYTCMNTNTPTTCREASSGLGQLVCSSAVAAEQSNHTLYSTSDFVIIAIIIKYKYKMHKYTNTAYDEVLERPNMWYIFEKRIVQAYQK